MALSNEIKNPSESELGTGSGLTVGSQEHGSLFWGFLGK